MNANEYKRWSADLFTKFPSVGTWFRDRDADGALTQAWFEALAECDIRDALVVNRRMLAGDDEGPDHVGWQNVPAHVRRLSKQARLRREEAAFGSRSEPALGGYRFACKRCRDSGFVYVASGAAVRCVLEGKQPLEKCVHREATARCGFCQRGRPRGIPASEAKPTDERSKIDPIPQFDERIHFLLDMGECGGRLEGAVVEEFVEWVHETHRKLTAGSRVAAFDEYNRNAEADSAAASEG